MTTRIGVGIALALCAGAAPAAAQTGDGGVTLRMVIAEALRHSPQLQPAQDAVERARIEEQATAARYLPRVSPGFSTGSAPAGLAQQGVGISLSQTLPGGGELRGAANSLSMGTGLGEFHDAGYSFGVSQPLLRGFGAAGRATAAAAADAARAARLDAADARQRLVMAAAHGYFALVREQRAVDDGARTLARATTLLEMSEARAKAGLCTQLDVLRAGLLRNDAQAASARAQDALDAAREDLNLLLGRTPEAPIVAAADLGAELAALDVVPAGGPPAAALGSRLDLQTAQARLDDVQRRAAAARWTLFPNVNLDVDYTRRGLGDAPSPFASLFNGWRVGFSTTYGFDRASAASATALADLQVRAAERTVSDVEQRAAVDVRRSQRTAARSLDVVALARASVDLALRQRDLAVYRFERGLADNLDVVDAENNLFRAQSAVIGAEIDRAMALLSAARATGALDPERFLR